MSPTSQDCRLSEARIRGLRALVLENSLLSVTVLPEKGCDIYSFVCRRTGIDILWKSPWGLQRTPAETEAQWLDQYEGGWQVLFPNAGDACFYEGASLPFHGEACLREWDTEIVCDGRDSVCLRLSVELCRSPFALSRTFRLDKNRPALFITERIENRSRMAMPYLWGHHPAFGAPFLARGCRIVVPARKFHAHEKEISPRCRLPAGCRGEWPLLPGKAGTLVDMSVVPGQEERISEFGYLLDLEDGWYAVMNHEAGLAFGLAWDKQVFPCLWFWQELGGCETPPWYGRCYVMAIEPFCAYPATGLAEALKRGGVPWLAGGASIETSLAAVCFEPGAVASVGLDGTVRRNP